MIDETALRGIGMTSQRTRDRLVERLREQGIKDERVLAAMRDVPRHLFIDEAIASRAYEDTALPIGDGQTISQPYVVARMTEALFARIEPQTVLEIGTGSGYQAAILAQMGVEVISVERIGRLISQARERLRVLGYHRVHVHHANGEYGWQRAAPYAGILVAAAPQVVPKSLLRQLADGGVLVIPVGKQGEAQTLLRVTRRGDDYVEEVLESVTFVPFLTGRA